MEVQLFLAGFNCSCLFWVILLFQLPNVHLRIYQSSKMLYSILTEKCMRKLWTKQWTQGTGLEHELKAKYMQGNGLGLSFFFSYNANINQVRERTGLLMGWGDTWWCEGDANWHFGYRLVGTNFQRGGGTTDYCSIAVSFTTGGTVEQWGNSEEVVPQCIAHLRFTEHRPSFYIEKIHLARGELQTRLETRLRKFALDINKLNEVCFCNLESMQSLSAVALFFSIIP